ncbi:MAG TPA: hypothetical protein VG838_10400 [Opitutaceae bacterium]|nr:hypothetical protein [Opitutaceae bacterium]
MIKRAFSWTALAGLAVALASAGFWLLFSTFLVYDDEGYVLLSLRNFSLHGGLYDRVYSQYGPFIYLLYDGLHRALGFAFTNTSGRWITLVNWFGTAALCATVVARQTRSTLWTAFTLAGVFTYLWVMINEPVHPGGLLALLVTLGAWLGAEAWDARRFERFAAVAALVGAALAFTKINVGVFFLGAAFAWLALNTALPRAAHALAWLVAAGCAVLPFGLMHSLFDAPWVRLFALVFTGAALALILAGRRAAQPVATLRTWAWFAGALFAGLALIAAAALARGTSPRGLLDGVILEPMKHPGVYFFAMNWRAGTGALALVSLAVAAASLRADRPLPVSFRHFVAAARLAAGAVFLCAPLQIIPTSLAAWGMCYGVTLAWLFALPLRDDGRGAAVRTWLALVLVFQFLHAYPVAGTQINWGTFLWVPLLALGLEEAAPVWRQWCGAWTRTAVLGGSLAIAAVTVVMPYQLIRIGHSHYTNDQPLRVPGAENIRPGNDIVYAVRIMRENLLAHADLLFSFPGLYSANLWTGLPTPTLTNATHWFSLLPPVRQREIVDRLAADPRSALLVERDVLDYLAKTGFFPAGPLHDWLMANYERSFAIDGYELWLRRGRRIAPLSTARLSPAGGPDRELAVTLAAPARPIVRIELCDFDAPRLPVAVFGPEALGSLQPVTLDDEPAGTGGPARFPLVFSGPARLTLRCPGSAAQVPAGRGLVVLRDADGAVVAEARVLN